jgi:hypothetical protein
MLGILIYFDLKVKRFSHNISTYKNYHSTTQKYRQSFIKQTRITFQSFLHINHPR